MGWSGQQEGDKKKTESFGAAFYDSSPWSEIALIFYCSHF
jgi:hypothetical protein